MTDQGWKDAVHTGHVRMDAEHQVELALLDALHEAVSRDLGPNRVAEVLEQLLEHTNVHFMSEQLLMRLTAYPQYEAHAEEHDELIVKARMLQSHVAAGETKPDGSHPQRHFTDAESPVFQVVDDAVVEHRIHAPVRVGKVLGVCYQMQHAPLMSWGFFEDRHTNHLRINIRGVDATGPESFDDEFDSGSSPATYLKTRRVRLHSSQFLEEESLLPLHKQTNRAVDPYSLRPIHFHFFPL